MLLWPTWTLVQTRRALDGSASARRVAAVCRESNTWSLVYRVTLLRGGGAVCSALVHHAALYSYVAGEFIPAYWSRQDCVMAWPRGVPFCSERALRGPGDWLLLATGPGGDIMDIAARSGR